jgi:two-component system, NarL family, response regulator NreC
VPTLHPEGSDAALAWRGVMRIVLVEDHLAYLESFKLAISRLSPIEVVGEAARAHAAFGIIESTEPDLVVSDLMLPDTDAVSLTRELRRRKIYVPIMVLTRVAHPMFLRDALRAGVKGFALKREPLHDLTVAIQHVAEGGTYVSPSIRDQIEKREGGAGDLPALDQLSGREREVFCLLLEGLTSKQIANQLYLSPKTVDAHRLHINRKLSVHSPAALARLVADAGLITG